MGDGVKRITELQNLLQEFSDAQNGLKFAKQKAAALQSDFKREDAEARAAGEQPVDFNAIRRGLPRGGKVDTQNPLGALASGSDQQLGDINGGAAVQPARGGGGRQQVSNTGGTVTQTTERFNPFQAILRGSREGGFTPVSRTTRTTPVRPNAQLVLERMRQQRAQQVAVESRRKARIEEAEADGEGFAFRAVGGDFSFTEELAGMGPEERAAAVTSLKANMAEISENRRAARLNKARNEGSDSAEGEPAFGADDKSTPAKKFNDLQRAIDDFQATDDPAQKTKLLAKVTFLRKIVANDAVPPAVVAKSAATFTTARRGLDQVRSILDVSDELKLGTAASLQSTGQNLVGVIGETLGISNDDFYNELNSASNGALERVVGSAQSAYNQQLKSGRIERGVNPFVFDASVDRLKALENALVYQLARANDPTGRLSINDVEDARRQLTVTGFTTSRGRALALLRQAEDSFRTKMHDAGGLVRALGREDLIQSIEDGPFTPGERLGPLGAPAPRPNSMTLDELRALDEN